MIASVWVGVDEGCGETAWWTGGTDDKAGHSGSSQAACSLNGPSGSRTLQQPQSKLPEH